MLDHIREQIEREMAQMLAEDGLVVLSTYGPAGLQVGRLPGENRGFSLYLLVPCAGDLLQNLEAGQPVVVTTPAWQINADAVLLKEGEVPVGLRLLGHPDRPWCVLARLDVTRFEKYHPQGWGTCESFDLK